MNKKTPKIGLAFGGGSALGISHIGIIKALKENNIPISCVSGTSAGAIAATVLAFDVPMDRIIALCKKANWSTISKFGYSKMGIDSNAPLKKLIIEMIGDYNIEDAKIPLAIVATDINTGKEFVFRKGKITEAILSSTCIPGFFVPVDYKGMKLVDGCLTENIPLSPLAKMGADIKIGVDLHYWSKFKKAKNILDVINNSFGILVRTQNKREFGSTDIIIKPRTDKFTRSDFAKIEQLIKQGYSAAMRQMPEIKKLLASKGKQQTQISFLQLLARKILHTILVSLLILLVPASAMLFTDQINWSAADFILAGFLLTGIGLIFELIAAKIATPK